MAATGVLPFVRGIDLSNYDFQVMKFHQFLLKSYFIEFNIRAYLSVIFFRCAMYTSIFKWLEDEHLFSSFQRAMHFQKVLVIWSVCGG